MEERIMADQAIELTDYDPGWLDQFREQQVRLTELLRPWLAAPIEHVGSTAVPGLRAKPIIDLLAPVRSLAVARAAIPELEGDGWLYWAEDPNQHYRLWFLRPDPAARTHHLQILEFGGRDFLAITSFREALRNDPVLRDAYARLKQDLARRHRDDRNAYTNAKSDFVRSVLEAIGVALPTRDAV
jgi:GrpB-like predicted nucleotidyltransferase (UPF0157 family)